MAFSEFGAEEWGGRLAEQDQQKTLSNALGAVKTMGEIAMQPAELALRSAQTRLYGAQAGEKEAELAAQKAMEEAAKGGAFATTPGASMSAPMFKMAQILWGSGQMKLGADMAAKGATILSAEYSAKNAEANMKLHNLQAQRAQVEQQSSEAASVMALPDDAAYQSWRMNQTAQGVDVSDLPQDFASAKRLLQPVVLRGMKAAEIFRMQEDAINTQSQITRRSVENRVSDVRIKELDASIRVKKSQAEKLEHELGAGAPLVKEAKQALIDSRRARQAELENRIAPSLKPEEVADPKLRRIGQVYTVGRNADGTPKRGTWTATGWIPFTGKLSGMALPPIEEDNDADD